MDDVTLGSDRYSNVDEAIEALCAYIDSGEAEAEYQRKQVTAKGVYTTCAIGPAPHEPMPLRDIDDELLRDRPSLDPSED
jgi:hypothetical protein